MKKILYILLFLFPIIVMGQERTASKTALKVGVVLSGGGAKGLAHIGALKEIEKAGVQIDYIGGTSMGAIIGALYASGYRANQLDSLFKTLDFETLISDDIPRRSRTFYEKDDAEKYALTLPFDNFKPRFPSGISKGQNVYNLLSKLLLHVKDVEDFNDLSIPFLCIATDVEQGKQVILDKGYLPRAVSASGALPSLFSPVNIDGTIFIDGGVVNNYPVDEVRAMGADIIIGVDVQDDLRSREELQTAIDVMLQINNYRTIKAMEGKIENTDVYINPNIENYTVVSFDEGQQIIDAGQEAAASLGNELEKIAAQQLPKKEIPVQFASSESLFINNVEIKGNERYTRSYILGKLQLQVPAVISYQEFSDGVNNLSATGNFSKIDYQFVTVVGEKNHYNLVFEVIESNTKNLLSLGVHYDDLYRSAALLNLTTKRLLTNNDVASLDFAVGDNIRYDANYYIDKGYYWSIEVSSRFQSFEKNISARFLDAESLTETDFQLNKIDLEYQDLTNQITFQTLFRRTFLLGLGAEHKWLKYLSETIGVDEEGNLRTVFENTNYFSAFGILKYDSLDNKFFPSEGFYFEGDFHWYLFASGKNANFEPFSIAKAKLGYAQRITRNISAYLTTEGGVTIGNRNTPSLDFFLGGYGFASTNNLMPMYGYEALALRGDTYLKTTLDIDYEFARKNHLLISGNIANIGDRLFETADWIDAIDYTGIAIGYGLETFLGPIELRYAYSPELKNDEWHISLGYKF